MTDDNNENISKILKQLTNGIQPLLDLTTVQKQNANNERTELLIEKAKIEEKITSLGEKLNLINQKLETNGILRKVIDQRIDSVTGNLTSMIDDIKSLEEELVKNDQLKQNQKMMFENNIVALNQASANQNEKEQQQQILQPSQPILNPLLNALIENQQTTINLNQLSSIPSSLAQINNGGVVKSPLSIPITTSNNINQTNSFTNIANNNLLASEQNNNSACDFSIRVTQSQVPIIQNAQSPQVPTLPNGLQQFSLLGNQIQQDESSEDIDADTPGENNSVGGSRKRDNRGKRVNSETAHQCPVCNKYRKI